MQKTTPKTHKTVPIFAFHSTHSYKTFLKNSPKNVHKLDLDSTTLSSLKPDRPKKALRNLIKLTRKSQNIKALQDVNLLKSFKAKKSQALIIMKRFHRVESLDVKWDFYDMQIQEETRRWLRFVKKLQSIQFRHVNAKIPLDLSEYKKKNMKLLKDIQQRRIIRLVHLPSPLRPLSQKGNYFPFDMRGYPSSLQEISFGTIQCVIDLDDDIDKLFSMKKFHLLTKLELFCLELNAILVILRTIPNPQLLTSLGLFLKNNLSESDEEEHLTFIFNFIMNNCLEIDKLNLRITHPTQKLKDLNLQDKLQVLNLWVSVKTEGHLEDLRLFLFTHKNLESLELTIDFDLDSVLSQESVCEFYQVFCQLTQLKKLRLNFSPKEESCLYFRIPPSLSSLMDSIACLSRLEELGLRIPDMEGGLQAYQLGEALKQVANQLRKLEVNFYWYTLDSGGCEEFIDLLGKMTKLKELSISQFSFTHEYNFSVFQKILQNSKTLEKIDLDQFAILPGGEDTLVTLILSMLKKKGLKEVRIKHAKQNNISKGKTLIHFSEIVKKNPGLRFVEVSSSNIWHGLPRLPFEHFKYA